VSAVDPCSNTSRKPQRLAVTLPDPELGRASDSPKGEAMGRSAPFDIGIENRRVRVSGELDMSTECRLIDAGRAIRGPVSVDLSGVSFIDARGLQALLRLWRAEPTLQIVAISERVARLLSITDTNFLIGRLTKVGTARVQGAA
jgi:anti-anti-sigma regulatory factor